MTLSLSADLVVDAGGFSVESHLTLEKGVLVLFGPSGAGKSLTLQALAGLVRPRSGRIVAGGEVLFDSASHIDVPAHARRVGWVPQHHSLFPHLDVEGNVAFGLPRAQRRGDPRVRSLLADLGLSRLAQARPSSLSGGERQRVALARALAVSPRLLLLDEPFASIDADGRAELRDVLRAALERHGTTPAVIVTHDREDALALGDRLVRFTRGATAEDGTPSELLGARPRLELVRSAP